MNADWAMVAITGVYCLATILILWSNYCSNSNAKKQLTIMKKQYDESNRAVVTAHLELIRNGLIAICVKNHGTRVAMKVNLGIHESSRVGLKGELKDLVSEHNRAVFTLGVGQSWYFLLGATDSMQQLSGKAIRLDLSYKDSIGEYKETNYIEYNEHFGPLLYTSIEQELVNEVKNCAKSIKDISHK